METFWTKSSHKYEVIVNKVAGWLQSASPTEARSIENALSGYGIPWRNICGLFGGSPEAVPSEVVKIALDSFMLKLAILAILADDEVSDRELQTAWPMTSELATSLADCFSDLRGFNHRSSDGHRSFLDAFNQKDGWFGGQCEWTMWAGALLVLFASIIDDAENPEHREQRALFTAFRKLTAEVVSAILRSDGVSAEELQLLHELDEIFDGLLVSQDTSEQSSQENAWLPLHGESAREAAASKSGSRNAQLSRTEALDLALKELNSLIGLESVKKEVGRLTSFLRVQEQRKQQNLKSTAQTLHFVFKGNPGTGKTQVARILSKVFYGFGLLQSTNVVECARSQLVGGYVGQTAIKTDEAIASALDGVLFIDEAYTLSQSSGGNDYGEEAINTVLKRMEDHRDRLIVIVAGYPALMDEFIRVNPGLESRFTRFITFEDYTVSELCQIFAKFAADDEYHLTPDCMAYLAVLFTAAYLQRNDRFGNARTVRNFFENSTAIHSERLSSLQAAASKEELTTLHAEDIMPMVAEVLKCERVNLTAARWKFDCPECGRSGEESGRFIGKKVKCKCGSGFTFPWWSLIAETVPELTTGSNRGANPFSS